MSYNLYTFSIPVFTGGLLNLSHLLEKAQTHPAEAKIPEKTFLDLRLAPDMNLLTSQVQNACYHATSVIDRLVRRRKLGEVKHFPVRNLETKCAKI
jgi:hypothetical protein